MSDMVAAATPPSRLKASCLSEERSRYRRAEANTPVRSMATNRAARCDERPTMFIIISIVKAPPAAVRCVLALHHFIVSRMKSVQKSPVVVISKNRPSDSARIKFIEPSKKQKALTSNPVIRAERRRKL